MEMGIVSQAKNSRLTIEYTAAAGMPFIGFIIVSSGKPLHTAFIKVMTPNRYQESQ